MKSKRSKKQGPVPSRSRLPAVERRELLLKSARRVFGRQGLAGTTLKDIGTEAGVDPAIVYRHFDNKDDIFAAAVVEPLERAVSEWTQLAVGSTPYSMDGDIARGFLGDKVGQLVAVMADLAPLIGAMLTSEHGPKFYAEHLGAAVTRFAGAIEAGKVHWKHRDYDSQTVAYVILGASMIAGFEAAYGGKVLDAVSLGRKLQDLVLDGVRLRIEEAQAAANPQVGSAALNSYAGERGQRSR